MHSIVKKALRAAAVCGAAAAVAVGTAVPAWAQGANTLALPIELNDFNADNVLFEYQLDGGLESLGTGSGQGLVDSTLGANGKPVYTRRAVESAAYNMAKQINSDWEATAPQGAKASLYKALQGKLRTATAQNVTVTDNGASAVSFGKDGWKATTNDHTAVGDDLYRGDGPAWKQDNDAVLGYSHATPLVRTYKTSDLLDDGATTFAGHNVMFKDGYNDASNKAGYTVTFSSGTWTSDPFVVKGGDAKPWTEVWVPSKDAGKGVGGAELTVTITPNEGASFSNPCRATKVTIGANKLHMINLDSGQIIYGTVYNDQTGLYTDGNRFYDNGWNAYDKDGNALDYENGSAVSGAVAWSRNGDGVVGYDTTSTIARTFDVTEDTAYSPYLWNAKPGMLIQFYAGEKAEGTPLATYDTTDEAAGWFVTGPAVSVPAGVTKLTVALTPKVAGADVAAVELNALGSVSKIGDYDATAAKYADGSKTLDDATTCMDYVYCVLNHLYDSASLSYAGMPLKTPVTGMFRSIVLNKNPEAEDGTDTGYSFVADSYHSAQKSSTIQPDAGEPADGYKDLKYDEAAGTIENVEAGTGEDRAGFFPLDKFEGGQSFKALFEYGKNDPATQAAMVEAMGAHNYHYSMVSHSSFTYEQGKGQFFTFEGDDDTYLFINNKLAIDLGGAHLAQNATVALDEPVSADSDETWAERLGLESGNSYNFDFFYMERHTDYSDFAVNTNIELSRRSLSIDASLAEEPKDGVFREGDNVFFKVTVKNDGTDTIRDIDLSNELPGAQIDWEKSGLAEDEKFTLKAGEEKVIYVKYTVTKDDAQKGQIDYSVDAAGKDGHENEVESPEASVTVNVEKPATPADPSNPNGGNKGEGGAGDNNGTNKTTKVSETTKTVKTGKGGLAQTGDRTVVVAIAVALMGAVVCALGTVLGRHRE